MEKTIAEQVSEMVKPYIVAAHWDGFKGALLCIEQSLEALRKETKVISVDDYLLLIKEFKKMAERILFEIEGITHKNDDITN